MVKKNHQSRWHDSNYQPWKAEQERRLNYLILTMPDRELVTLSLREGIDFLDEEWPEFGDFYVLETA